MELAGASVTCKLVEAPFTSQTISVDRESAHQPARVALRESSRCVVRSHRIEATTESEDSDLSTSSLGCDMSLDAVKRDKIDTRPLRDAPRLRLPEHRVRSSKSSSTPPPKSRLPRFTGRTAQHRPHRSSPNKSQEPRSEAVLHGSSSRSKTASSSPAPRSRSASKPPPYPTYPSRPRLERTSTEAGYHAAAAPPASLPARHHHQPSSHRNTRSAAPRAISPPLRGLSPVPRLHQLRDMHDDLTLDAELDLDLDEELRVMSFLRTPQNRIRTRGLALLSPQYSLSPASSPSALHNMSPTKQSSLAGHRSLPQRLSSPVRCPPPLPPPRPAVSPQRSPSPHRTLSRRTSFSTQGHLSPRPSLTSQVTASSGTGTLPLSPSASTLAHAAAAPARMPSHALHDLQQPLPQMHLSHCDLVTQRPSPAAAAPLRSSAPTSLNMAAQRGHAVHAVDGDSYSEIALDTVLRAPLSCQGFLRRGASMTDAQPSTPAYAAADACLPRNASLGASSASAPPPSVAYASTPQQNHWRGVSDCRQRELPGYASSDSGESGGDSDDDCSMGTLTLTPALAAECSELVRALAAGQNHR